MEDLLVPLPYSDRMSPASGFLGVVSNACHSTSASLLSSICPRGVQGCLTRCRCLFICECPSQNGCHVGAMRSEPFLLAAPPQPRTAPGTGWYSISAQWVHEQPTGRTRGAQVLTRFRFWFMPLTPGSVFRPTRNGAQKAEGGDGAMMPP